MQIVDTHAHIYHPDETAYPMKPDPHRPPPETGTALHLRKEMHKAGVRHAVLVQTGSEEAYPFRDMHPIVRRIIEAYGPGRCMWGSDFPCEHWLKKATYAEHLTLFTEGLGLSEGEQQAILEETPMRIWFK